MSRTPEQGHTPNCLAKTMIAAIENYRDEVIDRTFFTGADQSGNRSESARIDFRIWAQDNNALHWADGYLADGTSDCICPDA